jgi:hypothetical protein
MVPEARLSPALFGAGDWLLCSLVRGQESNGLLRPVPFFGVSANLFVERVVRFVSGGETGAYLGASGVFAGVEWDFWGVWGASGSMRFISSTSVKASSSSSVVVGLCTGKRSLGFTEARVRGRVSCDSSFSPEPSVSSGWSCSENLRKNFFPRLHVC